MKRWDRPDFTTLMLPLTTETQTSVTFFYRVKFETIFTSTRLVKQEDFCGDIALTYCVENCSDLP